MKRMFYLTLILLVFTACKKKKSPEPANSLYQYWSLDFTSRPYYQDPGWHSSALMASGRTYFTLKTNGTYTGSGLLGASGTFTVTDSAHYKILTLSHAEPPRQRVYVQVFSAAEMIMDTRTGPQPESYVRWKFGKNK